MDVDTRLLINLDRGQRNEQRVITILRGYPLPNWILGYREATVEHDIRGVDLFVGVTLQRGYINVPFQVKSSERSAVAASKKFEAKGYKDLVKILVVNEYRTDREIFDEIVTQLRPVRDRPANYHLFYNYLQAPLTYLEIEMKKGILRQQEALAAISAFSDAGRITVSRPARAQDVAAPIDVSAHS